MKTTTVTASAALAVLLAAAPAFALPIGAQPRINAEAGMRIGASTTEARVEARAEARAQLLGEREAKAKERGQKEIDRRIQMLTQLNERVQAMLKVSDDGKTSINATVQAQIAALTDLKSRIATDDSTTTLKADMQSITKSYRIFALIIPQGHIAVTADRIHTAIDSMTALIAKLQARIADAAAAGNDTTALSGKIADAQAQLATAGAAADAAVSLTANLQPDNGDKAVMDANKKALQDARAKLQAAMKALDAARKDLKDVVVGLKAFGINANANASSSASVQ